MDSKEPLTTRREFVASAAALPSLLQARRTEPDMAQLVSQGDLVYDKPASRSDEGIPIGTGRMGTLVWTTPSDLRMQINRVDVYASNSASNSFNERHNDYCGGCGFVDIRLAGAGDDPFPTTGFAQRLSIYNGLLTISGKGITCRAVASPTSDVIAISVRDERTNPEPAEIRLRVLRYNTKHFGGKLEQFARERVTAIQTGSHVAKSQVEVRVDRIILTQDFQEGTYRNKSAVAIGVLGRAARARLNSDTEVALVVPAGRGNFTILISSAATFDGAEDVAGSAFRNVADAAPSGFNGIARGAAAWWREFWSRSYIQISSSDGTAAQIAKYYYYFQYLMGCSSRGRFPPKFNGMVWNTGGDLRSWGAQHWYANLSCYYEGIPSTNRYELMDPVFDMYFGARESCALAAKQQWGSQGSYIPETMHFDGLQALPPEIAAEMAPLYTLQKPWEQRSERFLKFSETKHPHSSRWNWIAKREWIDGRLVSTERGSGPYGATNHILGTSAKIPYLFWRRYEYTLEEQWLRDPAYPMLKGAAEFYRNYPNFKKGPDGKYHIHHVNSNESIWGAKDTDEDLSAMRGVFAASIRASEILNIDSELRGAWKEVMQNLPPLPTSEHPDALKTDGYNGPPVFVRGLKPVIKPGGMLPDGNSMPAWFFDLCNLESSDKRLLEIANNTMTAMLRGPVGPKTPVGLLSKIPMGAATLGRAEDIRYLIVNQMRGIPRPGAPGGIDGTANFANRMSLREGPQALDAEALGRASEAVNLALLQSSPAGPGEAPVIRVFPAWPRDWDASFKLLARGAFLVSASMRGGKVELVEVESKAGAECRIRNPWPDAAVRLKREGRDAEKLTGSLLKFQTMRGERISIAPTG